MKSEAEIMCGQIRSRPEDLDAFLKNESFIEWMHDICFRKLGIPSSVDVKILRAWIGTRGGKRRSTHLSGSGRFRDRRDRPAICTLV